MATETAMTAAQRVLYLPEILNVIFTWIQMDEDYSSSVYEEEKDETFYWDRDYSLLCCSLVNKLWYHEAMFYLWKEPAKYLYFHDLLHLLKQIEPARRQFYANFIENAVVRTMCGANEYGHDDLLSGLAFPRLEMLKMIVDLRDYHIPRIASHGIKKLKVDPKHEYNPHIYIERDDMDELLERIPVTFPDLEEIRFDDYAECSTGALKRLAERLPRLKVFDHERLSTLGTE